MAPTLKPVFTFRVVLSRDDMLVFGSTKGGANRFVAPLVGGYLAGDGFHAELVPGGSDWATVDPAAGVSYLNGRAHFRERLTGDVFYMRCEGVVKLDDASQLAFAFDPDAKSTKAGDHSWFTTPIIEVSNEKHKWMEQSCFVSQGHWHIPGDGTQAAEHDVYLVVQG